MNNIPKTDKWAFVNPDITFLLKQFLVQYSCIHSLPFPLYKNDPNIFIYFPTADRIYTSIHNEYKEHYYTEHNESNQIISYYTYWKL